MRRALDCHGKFCRDAIGLLRLVNRRLRNPSFLGELRFGTAAQPDGFKNDWVIAHAG